MGAYLRDISFPTRTKREGEGGGKASFMKGLGKRVSLLNLFVIGEKKEEGGRGGEPYSLKRRGAESRE